MRKKTDNQIALDYLKKMEIDLPRDLLPMFENVVRVARSEDPTITSTSDFQTWVKNLPSSELDPIELCD